MIAIVLYAALDWLRGRDYGKPYTGRIAVSICGGLIICVLAVLKGYALVPAALVFLNVSLGLLLGYSWGWGKYFACFNGRYKSLEKEFPPADYIADKIYFTTSDPYLAGTAGMIIRHLLFYPLFVGLGLVINSYQPLLAGMGVIVGGLIYTAMRYMPERYALQVAEPLRGALLGFLLWMSL